MDREIHKVDRVLLRTGILLLAFALLGNACSADSTVYEVVHPGVDGTTHTTMHWRMLGSMDTMRAQHRDAISIQAYPAGGRGFWYWMLAAALVMVALGMYLHRQENRAVLVWNFLEQGIEVRAGDLCDSTGVDREGVAGALALINAQPGTQYVWDRKSDTIVDGRLRDRFIVLERCGNCGAHVDARVPLDLSVAPACQYCGAAASGDDVNRLRQEALRSIRAERPPGKGASFSPVLFVLLLLVFWPGAVGYAVWKSGLLARWLPGSQTA